MIFNLYQIIFSLSERKIRILNKFCSFGSRAVIGVGVEEEDRKHTWLDDAESVSVIRTRQARGNHLLRICLPNVERRACD